MQLLKRNMTHVGAMIQSDNITAVATHHKNGNIQIKKAQQYPYKPHKLGDALSLIKEDFSPQNIITAGITHTHVIIKHIRVDKSLSKKQIYQHLNHHAKTFFGEDANQLIIDYDISNETEDDKRLIKGIATKRSFIQTIYAASKQAELKVNTINIDIVAGIKVLQYINCVNPNEISALFFVSDDYLSLCISKNFKLIYAKSELLSNRTANNPDYMPTIHRALQFYHAQQFPPIERIFLAPDVVKISTLSIKLHEEMGIPVHTAQLPARILDDSMICKPSALLCSFGLTL